MAVPFLVLMLIWFASSTVIDIDGHALGPLFNGIG
jgi:hypothetical protein